MTSQTFMLPDGRTLGYAEIGRGSPIVYFHGTASSRLEIALLAQFAEDNRFKLVGIDRPGYGQSTPTKADFRSFAQDVNAIADFLGLNCFAVLSWSGGGPFALTYTALYPTRVSRIVTTGCPALPFDPAVAHNNNFLAKVAMKNRHLALMGLRMFRRSVLKANRDIAAYLKSGNGQRMLKGWSAPDARFFSDAAWLKQMYAAMTEGFQQKGSVETVYDEHCLFMQPWPEPLEKIPTGKLTLWQGAQDKTCPIDCAERISQLVKGSKTQIFQDEGHCVMFAKQHQLAQCLNNN